MPGEGDVAGVSLGWAGVAGGAAGAAGAVGVVSGVAAGAVAGVIVGFADASGLDVGADCSPQPAMNSPAIAAATETKKGVFMSTRLDAGVERVFTGGISQEGIAVHRAGE